MPKKWLLLIAGDWLLVAAALAVALYSPWLIPLALLVIGTRQHAIAVLGHDAAHWPSRRWDWLVSALCFAPSFASMDAYRRFHLAHHQLVGTPDDPELQLKRVTGQFSKPLKPWWHLGVLPLLNLLGAGLIDIWSFAWVVRPTLAGALAMAAGHATFIAVCMLAGLWLIPVLWYVALGTVFWFTFEVRVWFEHQQEQVTTTRLKRPPWLARAIFFPHNVWAHAFHHRHPSVACWDLFHTQGNGQTLQEVVSELKGRSDVPLALEGGCRNRRCGTRHYFHP